MTRTLGLSLLLSMIPAAAGAQAPQLSEQVINVPGFADFLAVDGDTVWTTNQGRVEQWSTKGKNATTSVPKPCGAMALAYESLWVANCDGGSLYRIDKSTAKVQAVIPTGVANPKGELNVVAGAGSVWIASDGAGKISRVDPATNKVSAQIPVEAGTFFLAFGFNSLWAVSSDKNSLQRIDPKTNAVARKVGLGKQPGFLAAGEEAVWVQEQGAGTVARIDPKTVTVTGRAKVGKTLMYGDIDTGGGKVWLRTTEDQTFAVIDPKSLKVVARLGKPAGSGALRYTPAGVWTSAHDVHTLSWWSAEGGKAK
jgi:DNA-binding beta-propeller fold protein YncE